MAECPEFVIWNPVPPGSKFCVESSAKKGDTASKDYNSGVHIVEPGGTATDWKKSDLDPGPASISPLKAGGYGASTKLFSGPSGPTVTLHAWIEPPHGPRPFECTWTNSEAGTEFHTSITIVVKSVVKA